MPYSINTQAVVSLKDINIEKLISTEIEKYISNTLHYKEVELVFLKSIIYVEELVKEINMKLHGTVGFVGLERHIELMKLIKDDTSISKSISFLERIKGFRNNMAHKLEYQLEQDPNFLREFKINKNMDLNKKRYEIAMYFKDVAHGFIFLKIGMSTIKNFIIYEKD
jgi:uncharacterized protein (DUF2132 family)